MATPPTTIVDVLSRVDTLSTDCWIWTGALSDEGYGVTAYEAGPRRSVHRLMYETFIGPIPDGLHIDHLCRIRSCCNPKHLEPVTVAVNNRRSSWNLNFTGYCRKGIHDITKPGAVRINANGRRTCAECRKETKRRSYARTHPKP